MSELSIPPIDKKAWPTLGPGICDFIQAELVHGPGDLRGQPAVLDEEKRGLIYRAYEVYPKGHRNAGRRRFSRVAVSLRKGSAKTEFAAWLAICELHPHAPVRTVGWNRSTPTGGGVVDPYIPMVAYTEEQSEELAYGALRVILENCAIGKDFDIGLERVMRLGGDGKAEALSAAPEARDGARTTFQVFDETHRLVLPRLKRAHRTMLANIPKRMMSDAWSFEITTAYAPGQMSVAEETMEYARAIAAKKIKGEPRLFFFHRQASEKHNLKTKRGLRAAVLEASGPVASWSNVNAIVDLWDDPGWDKNELQRLWLNQPVRGADRAFDVVALQALAKSRRKIAGGVMVTLGFDGARYHDSTALVATEIETGHQALVGVWERPHGLRKEIKWEVPEDEVEEAVAGAFERWNVWRLYADPPYWETNVAKWAGEHGEKCAVSWPTNRWRKMADAVLGYVNAIASGEVSYDGNQAFVRHFGNAIKRPLTIRDDKGDPMWIIQKERPDSPHKIDVAMAAILSWEARRDALTEGVGNEGESLYSARFAERQNAGEDAPAPEIIDSW